MENSQLGWNDSTDVLQGIMVERDGHDLLDTNPSLPFDASTNSLLDIQLASLDSAQNSPSFMNPWSSNPRELYGHQYTHHTRLTSGHDVWNPLLITGVPPTSISHMNMPPQIPDQECGFSHHYSDPSDTGSQFMDNYHSADSGYEGTSCATQSVVASSYGVDSFSPRTVPKDNISAEPRTSFDHPHYGSGSPYTSDFVGSPSQSNDGSMRCDHASCPWIGKCPSDKRKHEARHKKQFKCDVPNCARKEGFGTINDLARHKKCVHNKEPERGPKMMYMCFGRHCPRLNKEWPRLDNFKQHLNRMHSEEDGEILLKKSMDWYEKVIRQQPQQTLDEQSSRDESVFEAQEDIASVQSTGESEPDHASVSQQKAGIFTFGTGSPQIVQQGAPSLSGIESSHFPAFGSLGLSANQDASTERGTKPDGPVADAADNLINAMTKVMNNRGRKPSQTIDEGIDLGSDNTQLSPSQRQMLQKVLSVALERLSDENEGTPQDFDNEKRDWFQCDACSKKTRLRCEMKKHQKRHERPYGCTFPHCAKSFGSKADWKRHESSQHLHVQSWFCTEHVGNSTSCEQLFYRLEKYTQHLRQHGVEEYQVAASVGNNRLDLADGSHFWCGFCNHRVTLTKRGQAARDERFNHIDIEHFKKGERGQDWRFPSSSFGIEEMAQSENVFHTSKNTSRRTATVDQRKRKYAMV
ncbi:hypothetical protein N7457_004001 [Penicillium paradoxum]|uniref:uncharacterized protein n=1 Tax=Penicillium paradoxum TaxID=176176 RepID=UPI0025474C2B|nr:uncharacterized protein N7457_004001 [Penicillium paradoxum]KAJ5782227.1 hypothetical protein N7457_004001 [Penicillium paradoxum]